jgi:peptidoglycan/LPS O-acetylase OafA/YrhL
MKKAIITFVLAALVVITTVIWILTSRPAISIKEILPLFVLILVVAFAVFVGYKRLKSVRRGEPVEDELSKRIMQKTAAWSFYISLYLWLAVMYFSDKLHLETHTLIGGGILGMAVIFAGCWMVFNFRGMKNE